MRVQVKQAALAEALSGVSRAINRGSAVPILSGVSLAAGDGVLVLQATDLEIALEQRVPAEVAEPGAAVLPGLLLSDLARRLPGGQISLTGSGEAVEVRAEGSRFRLQGLPADQFPERFQAFNGGAVGTSLPRVLLLEALRRTAFVADRDCAREYLRGVRLSLVQTGLEALATDSVRAAHTSVALAEAAEGSVAVTLPLRGAVELARLLAAAEDDSVRLTADGNRVVCAGGGWRLEAQLLAGAYPDILRLLPREYRGRVQVRRAEVQAALERCLVVAEEVAVRFEPGRLEFRGTKPEVGRAEEQTEVTAVAGELPGEVWFNGRLLLEPLRLIGTGEVALEFRGPREPARITGVGAEGFEYVLLPLLRS